MDAIALRVAVCCGGCAELRQEEDDAAVEAALRNARAAAAGQEEYPALHRGPTWVTPEMVRRVKAARDEFTQRQMALDGVLLQASQQAGADGAHDAFDPVGLVERVSELVVGEVVDECMDELVGMMDAFVDQVVDHELTPSTA
jgi:hypothetical protein